MAGSTPNESSGAVTVLLVRLQRGDRTALSELMDALYPELRALARALLRSERPNHSLQPTALVNEAYIRLVGHRAQNWEHRAHFSERRRN
jgi:DNA-directed RNA polymerase specialized sigma24 family protein